MFKRAALSGQSLYWDEVSVAPGSAALTHCLTKAHSVRIVPLCIPGSREAMLTFIRGLQEVSLNKAFCRGLGEKPGGDWTCCPVLACLWGRSGY